MYGITKVWVFFLAVFNFLVGQAEAPRGVLEGKTNLYLHFSFIKKFFYNRASKDIFPNYISPFFLLLVLQYLKLHTDC